MYFANAPREIWALGRRYSALLNNMMATRYNQGSKAIIPLLALGVKIDFASLLPFGCLVMCHRAKEQVKDGYCDTCGVEGAFVGYSWMDDVKGLVVYPSTGKIVTTVFWKADATYLPWRPDGQRRLKSDGSFGDEGRTARVFSQIPKTYSFDEIIAPRALATSGRRPGVRAKRAARGVAGHQLWTGRREKTAHPSIAIIK